MERKSIAILVVIGISCCWLASAVSAAETPAPPVDTMPHHQASSPPPVKMVKPGVFEVGGCTIHKELSQVVFPASVNMKEGLLEYLLVSRAGKLHESLLQTDIEPYALQIALLLTGLEGSSQPLALQGQAGTPSGDPIRIWLGWAENGEEKKIPIEQWVLVNQRPVTDIPWVFTGSVIAGGVFMAQADKSIVAVYHDPVAMIDHQLESGANDEVWTVNSSTVPMVGTKVKVIIEKK